MTAAAPTIIILIATMPVKDRAPAFSKDRIGEALRGHSLNGERQPLPASAS